MTDTNATLHIYRNGIMRAECKTGRRVYRIADNGIIYRYVYSMVKENTILQLPVDIVFELREIGGMRV